MTDIRAIGLVIILAGGIIAALTCEFLNYSLMYPLVGSALALGALLIVSTILQQGGK